MITLFQDKMSSTEKKGTLQTRGWNYTQILWPQWCEVMVLLTVSSNQSKVRGFYYITYLWIYECLFFMKIMVITLNRRSYLTWWGNSTLTAIWAKNDDEPGRHSNIPLSDVSPAVQSFQKWQNPKTQLHSTNQLQVIDTSKYHSPFLAKYKT